MYRKRPFLMLLFLLSSCYCLAQSTLHKTLKITVQDENGVVMHNATVSLLKTDSTVVQVIMTDNNGQAEFTMLAPGMYLLKTSFLGFETSFYSSIDLVNNHSYTASIKLKQTPALLGNVRVTAKKPLVQFLADKTVINVEAGVTNAGATVMDVLEKSPGITVGRDGTIIMKGKPQVMVLIDGKQTQLSGAELQAYLSGLSASQIDVIELIDNPGARYDAAGNAGIINIKTKVNKQKGFNGSLSLSIGQGFYTKGNNSLNMNYRSGKFNFFVNYGNRLGRERMKLYALRKYFDTGGNDSLLLRQPNVTRTKINAHNLKAGVDFFAGPKTTMSVAFTGTVMDRIVRSFSTIDWMTPAYETDSSIITQGTRNIRFERAGVNLNGRHTFKNGAEISADVDIINFDIAGDQYFQTQVSAPGTVAQLTKGNIPSELSIFAAKIDYSRRFKKLLWEAGAKTASTATDNLAAYYFNNGSGWQDDLGRSNHFLYDEKIHSVYSSVDAEAGKWHWQTGLRYEITDYKANQLGNTVVKDSAFQKNYGSLFPSAFVSFEADSNNTFTFRLGRRIDRPQFQNLNPFLVTLNKYTFESGNPFIRPQYTWNFELSHTFRQVLSTTLSYSYLKDYFSQIFVIDSNSSNVNKNIIIYTRGNVGTFHNIGLTMSFQVPVTKWWNLAGVAVYNHKVIEGVVWAPLKVKVDQLNLSVNNQFQFKKGWAAELSGYYQTNSQIDLQESLTPQGEMNIGVSKKILKEKGTLRLTVRDILKTQNYSGYSTFQNSDEPFKVKWDSRVVRLTFNWRFGKTMKAIKRSSGGAAEEAERVGSGG